MREITFCEIEHVAGGGESSRSLAPLEIAEVWAGGVAAVGLGFVGAPVIVAGAIGVGLGLAFTAANHMIQR